MEPILESEPYEQSIFGEEQIPVVYAGFWVRFAALFIDWLLLVMFSFITSNSRTAWFGTAVGIIIGLAGLIYKPLLEYLYGATLGKKAMSIVVVNKMYEKPDLKEVLLRNIFGIVTKIISLTASIFVFANVQLDQERFDFGMLQGPLGYTLIISSILGLVYIADVIVLLADKQNRALHDFIGKTYVIKK
jgi:uncharacterized RDD family membrane protein YckC